MIQILRLSSSYTGSTCVAVVLALGLFLGAGCATTGSEQAVITKRPTASTEDSVPVTDRIPDEAPQVTQPMVEAGRFDAGKMWTFDNPPLAYFKEAYDLDLADQWFELASRAALRFGEGCSASFVSPRGLVMTNHHCARESISKVSGPDEGLLDHGFYAASLEAERKVPDLFVDQLVKIEDVTERVREGLRDYQNDDDEADARRRRIEQIEKIMSRDVKNQDTTMLVQIVSLYNGGKYSAYTMKRYMDVRLVVAPELQMGSFGGDLDNFTYPRYSLDMMFFRVYDVNGAPLETQYYFPWSKEGVKSGDAVFVVGNPGGTSRLNTVSQLEYERDHELPQQLDALQRRAQILKHLIDTDPVRADSFDLRNSYYQLTNQIKAYTGQLEGLRDDELIARRRAAETMLQQQIEADPKLKEQYANIINNIDAVQAAKKATARQSSALTLFGGVFGSRILTRALYGYAIGLMGQRGAPPETLNQWRKDAAQIEDVPPEIEKAFVQARFDEIAKYLGRTDPTLRGILQGKSTEERANMLVDSTALVDSTGFFRLLDEGYLQSGDPTVPVINALAPLFFSLDTQQDGFAAREENLSARLAQARFEVVGTGIPPDATFSLRLSDGVVKGYEYNGTTAPVFTTFYGLYSHYYSYGMGTEWGLPERWANPPEGLDMSTPLNLVSTNDITGGNSGSPLLNSNLEVVGLIFDGNIESLPNEYLYREEVARAISVDARGIVEALDEMYDADRVVLELTTGQLVDTEEAADAVLED